MPRCPFILDTNRSPKLDEKSIMVPMFQKKHQLPVPLTGSINSYWTSRFFKLKKTGSNRLLASLWIKRVFRAPNLKYVLPVFKRQKFFLNVANSNVTPQIISHTKELSFTDQIWHILIRKIVVTAPAFELLTRNSVGSGLALTSLRRVRNLFKNQLKAAIVRSQFFVQRKCGIRRLRFRAPFWALLPTSNLKKFYKQKKQNSFLQFSKMWRFFYRQKQKTLFRRASVRLLSVRHGPNDVPESFLEKLKLFAKESRFKKIKVDRGLYLAITLQAVGFELDNVSHDYSQYCRRIKQFRQRRWPWFLKFWRKKNKALSKLYFYIRRKRYYWTSYKRIPWLRRRRPFRHNSFWRRRIFKIRRFGRYQVFKDFSSRYLQLGYRRLKRFFNWNFFRDEVRVSEFWTRVSMPLLLNKFWIPLIRSRNVGETLQIKYRSFLPRIMYALQTFFSTAKSKISDVGKLFMHRKFSRLRPFTNKVVRKNFFNETLGYAVNVFYDYLRNKQNRLLLRTVNRRALVPLVLLFKKLINTSHRLRLCQQKVPGLLPLFQPALNFTGEFFFRPLKKIFCIPSYKISYRFRWMFFSSPKNYLNSGRGPRRVGNIILKPIEVTPENIIHDHYHAYDVNENFLLSFFSHFIRGVNFEYRLKFYDSFMPIIHRGGRGPWDEVLMNSYRRYAHGYLFILKNFYLNYYAVKRAKTLPMHYGLNLVYKYLALSGNLQIEYVNRRFLQLLKTYKLLHAGKYVNRLAGNAVRKKKSMFKLKILFDRLFLWLYNIKNVEFFLGSKIKLMADVKKNPLFSFLYGQQYKKLI